MKSIAFLGKGGVGKTTLAVEAAYLLSDAGSVVVLSLDQQHNHADYITQRGYDLDYKSVDPAVSTDVQEVIERSFIRRFKEYAPLVAPDFVVVCSLAEMLAEVEDDYEYAVFDIPPNANALQMLQMPNVLESVTFKALTIKNRIKRAFTGNDFVLDKVEHFVAIVKALKAQLTRTAWIVTGIPSFLGLLETEKMGKRLNELGLPIGGVVCNMVSREHACECTRCSARTRRERRWVDDFRGLAREFGVTLTNVEFALHPRTIRRELASVLRACDLLF